MANWSFLEEEALAPSRPSFWVPSEKDFTSGTPGKASGRSEAENLISGWQTAFFHEKKIATLRLSFQVLFEKDLRSLWARLQEKHLVARRQKIEVLGGELVLFT